METRSRTRSRKRDAVDHEHEDEEMRLANGQREATRKALKDEGSMRATGTFNLRRAHSSRALKSAKTVNNLCTHASKASFRLTRSNSRISADEKERSKNDFLEAHARVKRQIQNMGRTTISPQSTCSHHTAHMQCARARTHTLPPHCDMCAAARAWYTGSSCTGTCSPRSR